ncbi:MAG: GNAT family N-acetyltransferase [Bacteroidota bacterium]
MELYTCSWEGYELSTDFSKLQFDRIHAYLTQSYWSPGISRENVRRAARHSLPFGLYRENVQVGYTRVISDFTRFAYMADVYVDESEQGNGVGKWLIKCILSHPELEAVGRWMLLTNDAHGLYQKFGFRELLKPETVMERVL